jgi:hypothetical protein
MFCLVKACLTQAPGEFRPREIDPLLSRSEFDGSSNFSGHMTSVSMADGAWEAFLYRNFLCRSDCLNIHRLLASQPDERFLEIGKSSNVPSVQSAHERKHPGAVMWVGGIKHREPVFGRETDFGERVHQRREIGWRKNRFRSELHTSNIEKRLLDAAFVTRARERCQCDLARSQIKHVFPTQPDELSRTNDL